MSSSELNSEINEWDDSDINLKTSLLRGIYSIGFEKPSPVQKKVIKPMTQIRENGKRRDIIAQAQSGTGKTGCFSVSLNNLNPSDPEDLGKCIVIDLNVVYKTMKDPF